MAEDPLTAAINNAIAENEDLEDSEKPPVEETEEQPDESEETEETETDESDEDPEESDEENSEEVDEDEEAYDAEDDEDEESPEPDEDDDLYTVKVRGEEIEVTLDELRDGYSRQEDYTKSKQELAERQDEVQQVYDQMREWYESRSSDPAGWIQEIVDTEADTSADVTLAQAIARTDNPTGLLARTFKVMAQSGTLDDDFVEEFGLQDIAKTADKAESEDRITRLERELEEEREARRKREQSATQQQRQQEIVQEYERQWDSIVQTEDLEFDSNQAEFDAKVDLMRFAKEREIVNLEDAWSAMQYQRSRQQNEDEGNKPKSKKRSKKARAAAKRKKKKAAAMNNKPTGGPTPTPRKKGDTDAAIEEAAKEMGIL